MEHKIWQMFYLKNSQKTKGNLTPTYLGITIKIKRYEEAIHWEVDVSERFTMSGRMKG